MSTPSQSIADVDSREETDCIGCDSGATDEYQLVLDGEQTVSIQLCKECYDRCYERILGADWIEEPA